jgi:Ca-activated chloride channel family protein
MHLILTACVALACLPVAAVADGFIVPIPPPHPHPIIRPPRPIPFRGSWAVKYHHVDVRVRDQVASVSIDQAFVNTGKVRMEAEYFFPAPPDAAIDSMTLMVDGKEYAARLLKAEEARKIYEATVRRLKDPALLEYAGYGLFKTRAFPLDPGKPVKVHVTYKNVCKKDRDLVEVWYPLNTEKFSAKPIESVRVTADIKSKADITAVYSPTHDLDVRRKGSQHVIVSYEAKKTLPVTDFQVYYKAADEAVGATLMTHLPEAGKDGYFLLLVSPNPKAARDKVAPKDVVLVFDHSGSMSGEKIKQAREALTYVLKNLNAEDRFEVVAYSDAAEPFFGKLVGGEKRIAEAVERVDAIDAGGATDIHAALQVAMQTFAQAEGDARRPAYVLFLTDGKPTTGKTTETTQILKDTKLANKADARLFAFGVGYDPNVRLLDKLASENGGRSDYVKPKEPIEAKVSSLYNKIKNPVMTGLKMSVENVRLSDTYPREPGDLFDGDQILMVGRYSGKDANSLPPVEAGVHHAQLLVRGVYQGQPRAFEYNVHVRSAGRDIRYAFVEKLWAIRRVGYLLDQIQLHGKSQEVIDEIVRLSMKYGIMTPYTSFLAEEKTRLADRGGIRSEALRHADALHEVAGATGQLGAANRQALNQARRPAAAAAPSTRSGKGAAVAGGAYYGYKDSKTYEEDEAAAAVETVRQFADQAAYRRGKLWVAANAADLDGEKDKDKIKTVKRFSDEYFELIRKNTVAENQILASQQEDEELLIVLRNQAYLIK